MKKSLAAVAVVALGLAGNATVKGNGNAGSNSGGAAPHHSSTATPTTTVAPHFNGMPHYSGGAMPYRAIVSYPNGNRTLNYPPVGNSVLRHQLHSGANSLNSGYALQRGGNLHQTGNLRQAGNRSEEHKSEIQSPDKIDC